MFQHDYHNQFVTDKSDGLASVLASVSNPSGYDIWKYYLNQRQIKLGKIDWVSVEKYRIQY